MALAAQDKSNMGGSIVMGVPKNDWFITEIPIKMDDDWVYPILGNLNMIDWKGAYLNGNFVKSGIPSHHNGLH